MIDVLLDNDVAYKMIVWELDGSIPQTFGTTANAIAVLGSARFVIAGVAQRAGLRDFPGVLPFSEVEPTADELGLAADILEEAALSGADVDAGEAILAAVAVRRSPPVFATGDKRAVRGLGIVAGRLTFVADGLRARIVCLESMLLRLLTTVPLKDIRRRICKHPMDRALVVVMRCGRASPSEEDARAGLKSYENDAFAGSARALRYP